MQTTRALSVGTSTPRSLALDEVPVAAGTAGDVLVETRAVGLCGTDREIVEGQYGSAPPGESRLILGHESIGRVVSAPANTGFSPGDWVVGIVRRPDPVPCPSCAAGEWDMCRNDRYTECGIRERHGFGRDLYVIEPEYLVKVEPGLGELGVLVEPASVVAKAWEHALHVGARAHFEPKRVLVTGAGTIGLLAALFGTQRGFDVHVLDRKTDGPKPELVRTLGAKYHSGPLEEAGRGWDLIFECTGAPSLFFAAIHAAAPSGIVCLTGVSAGGKRVVVDPAELNRELVLENKVVFGSVNANRRHYQQASAELCSADRDWLQRLITHRFPVERWRDAFAVDADGVKTILTF
jgi:2-desacetyl-2-hydroxyethyl bacteriochlorophyllide A dehydrogenase